MARQKTLLGGANASAKRNLISVGGCADTPVHVDAAGNADGNRPCLGNGQTVLMRTPTQAEFVECWSEAIIRNGLPPALVDDPLFRKALVTTSRMGWDKTLKVTTQVLQPNPPLSLLRWHERRHLATSVQPSART
jgi:hypothetical protein